jgi:hypothetical protein
LLEAGWGSVSIGEEKMYSLRSHRWGPPSNVNFVHGPGWKTLSLGPLEVGGLFDFDLNVGGYLEFQIWKLGRFGGGGYVNLPSLIPRCGGVAGRYWAPFMSPGVRPFVQAFGLPGC